MESHDNGMPDRPFGRNFENTPAGAAVKDLENENNNWPNSNTEENADGEDGGSHNE